MLVNNIFVLAHFSTSTPHPYTVDKRREHRKRPEWIPHGDVQTELSIMKAKDKDERWTNVTLGT